MVMENRLFEDEVRPAALLASDAYEAYWSSTEDDDSARAKGRSYSFETLPFCQPGEAYNQFWQLADAR